MKEKIQGKKIIKQFIRLGAFIIFSCKRVNRYMKDELIFKIKKKGR